MSKLEHYRREIQRLQDENATLRQELDVKDQRYAELQQRNDELVKTIRSALTDADEGLTSPTKRRKLPPHKVTDQDGQKSQGLKKDSVEDDNEHAANETVPPSPANMSLDYLIQRSGDPSGKRLVIGLVQARKFGETKPSGPPRQIVTAGNDDAGRISYRVLPKDIEGRRVLAVSSELLVSWEMLTARNLKLLGRFTGATEKEVRNFIVQWDGAGCPTSPSQRLGFDSNSPRRRSA